MEASKKIIVGVLAILFILGIGRYLYAQVTENIQVTAQVVPATLEMSGYTFPDSLVTISNFGTPMGTTMSLADGSFAKTFSPLTPGTYEITVYATDNFGTDTQPRTFNFTIQQNQVVTYDSILLPPTVYATTPVFNQAEQGTVTAYGKPNQVIYLDIQGTSTETISTTTDSTGKGVFSINGGSFLPGTYTIYAYFEAAYPSDSLTIEIQPGPTATPTPIPTSTPPMTATPIPVTGGPGPSATPGPEPTGAAGTVTPELSPTPFCVFPFSLLCNSDDNDSGEIDTIGEQENIIRNILNGTFDVNEDGIVDSLDLSIALSYITGDASTLRTYRAGAVENDGLCSLTLASPLNYSMLILILFGLVSFLLVARLTVHSLGLGSNGFSLMQVIALVLMLTSAYFIYQSQTIPTSVLTTQVSTKRNVTEINSPLTYNILASSKDKPMNTLDLYLSFNPQAMRLTTIDLTESFATVVSRVEYSNKCGKIHIIGGIPKPATYLYDEHFAKITFRVRRPDFDTSLVLYPGTRAFKVNDKKQTDAINPSIKIIPVTK